jgi:hypothetical protein
LRLASKDGKTDIGDRYFSNRVQFPLGSIPAVFAIFPFEP